MFFLLLSKNLIVNFLSNNLHIKFVNKLSEELRKKTGTRQRTATAYHLKANGLVERENQSIKRTLAKVLEDAALE